mmetsp:Transcript_3725/g.9007  ORF Transcript_3725/g.9007 Transcript_3725/m.9007 type:complete len:323 (+) Transcript_3725:152-1120(+)
MNVPATRPRRTDLERSSTAQHSTARQIKAIVQSILLRMTRAQPKSMTTKILSILATIAAIQSASHTIAAEAFSASTTSASTTSIVTDVPPLIDVPVWSMATLNDFDDDEDNDEYEYEDGKENSEPIGKRRRRRTTNANILTYATPVSIRPERLYALGLYKPTRSRENLLRERTCVLQLLTEDHVPCVRLLGGTSGADLCKEDTLGDLGVELQELSGSNGYDKGDEGSESNDLPRVLPGCVRYLHLTVVGDGPIECADGGGEASHDVVLCRVQKMWTSASTSSATGEEVPSEQQKRTHLSTGRLRELGIITEQGRIAPEEPAL